MEVSDILPQQLCKKITKNLKKIHSESLPELLEWLQGQEKIKEQHMAGYLFVHFTGEHKNGEQIYFSISRDGLFWKDLNGAEPVLLSDTGTKGVRDPYIVRDPDRGRFYLIATDLRIEAHHDWKRAQYEGSRDIIVWESENLVQWSKARRCRAGADGAGCVWAPEAVYDEKKKQFFVFFASMIQLPGEKEAKQRIYAVYTKDFREFSAPSVYIEKKQHVIDTTIVHADGMYYRFSKDEETSRILMEKSSELEGTFEKVLSRQLDSLKGVEGPECYLLPDGKTWCLMLDRFAEGKGYLPLLSEDLSSGEFRILSDGQYGMGRTQKRHGGILKLSSEEYERLEQAYGSGSLNPVLDGLYADPDMAYFDGKYYLYPTTDGFKGWSGTAFFVFCSDSLKRPHFQKAGLVLDFAKGDVPWAAGCAWAPCIARKDGNYYFYFCGKNKDGVSCIGAAVSDSPAGPFTAQKEPLVTMEMMRAGGIRMSQTIDPSIYMEGNDAYLLFGNGEPAIAKLTEDMLHIQKDTLANLKGLCDFREAVSVFKRNGIYHFTWSCDDTGSEDYHVSYGTSDSLYGPVHFEKIVLQKQGESYGTGHHCIFYDPQKDGYRAAFHRFAGGLCKYPGEHGYHREICLADVKFGEDGRMEQIIIR